MKSITEYIKEGYWTSTSTLDIDDMDLSKVKITDKNIKDVITKILKKDPNADLNHLDVSNVTDMSELFAKMNNINPDISQWDVSHVEDMRYMFYECKSFNCDISKWDVSKVKNMCRMFEGCKKFNQDLSQWDVSNVQYADFMFDYCPIKEGYKPKFKTPKK